MHNKKISLLYKNHLNIFSNNITHNIGSQYHSAAPVESISGYFFIIQMRAL